MTAVEHRPLRGRRIVVTRARVGARRFSSMLRAMGAEAIEFPTIETVPADSYALLDSALARLEDFDWLVFTSATGVDAFVARMRARGRALRESAQRRIAAIGPATARRLEYHGLHADRVPAKFRAEAIVEAIGADRVRGARFLIPRAQVAREVLPAMLLAAGAREAIVAPAYRTIIPSDTNPEHLRGALRAGAIDLVTFTSSSTVENFCTLLGADATRVRAGVIGPITAETARACGFTVVLCPADYTIKALAEAIAQFFSRLSAA